MKRSGQYNMNDLAAVMEQIIENVIPLPPERKDHKLIGNWKHHRECHISGDWLLIYRITKSNQVFFVRTGTHSELFC